MKGGATGSGHAQVVPMEDINLHFTGDFATIEKAHNLLAALIDNNIQNKKYNLGIDPRTVHWKRVMDMNDRSLRKIIVGLGGTLWGSRVKLDLILQLLRKSWLYSALRRILPT